MNTADDIRAHADRSPSSASQWRGCPGSVKAQKAYDDSSGVAAAEGTLFHEFAEIAFSHGFAPHIFKGNIGNIFHIEGHEIEFTKEMILGMYEGLDWLNEQQADDLISMTEKRVNISPWTLEEDGFGTSDNILIFPTDRRIIIQDWKYGRVAVSPEWNNQAILYALGAWNDYAKEIFDNDPSGITVDVVIDQPRAPGGGGIWRTNMKTLLKEGENIKVDAQRVIDNPDLYIPGTSQCMYCLHSVNCEANARFNLEMAGLDFDDLEDYDPDDPPAPPSGVTPEQRSAIILHYPVIKRWVDQLTAQALDDHAADRPVPGLKRVTGRAGRRKFRPAQTSHVERLLTHLLGDKAYDIKLISPAVAQDYLGKPLYERILQSYVDQAEGKPQLVSAEDAREALSSVTDMFDEIL